MSELTVRSATLADAGAILNIYKYYVNQTAVSFEWTEPTLEEFRGRMEKTLEKYPYLVAEKDGVVLGYAYAGPFGVRASYGWSVDLTIYLDRDVRGRGIGRILYGVLEDKLKEMGIQNMYACIAETEREEDEHLTHASARFHARMGFREIGRFRKCGYKFGKWYDTIRVEKLIGDHPDAPPPVARAK